MSATSVVVVNPLGSALRHYSDALVEVLEAAGATTCRLDVAEPRSIEGGTRLGWVRQYAAALRVGRQRAGPDGIILVTWPVLGYLDLLLFRLLRLPSARTVVVLHDPEPLVRSIGYGRASQLVARMVGAHVALLTHGREAADAVLRHGVRDRTLRVPHPMRRRREAVHNVVAGSATPSTTAMRVLGTYKADRDLELLAEVAQRFGNDVALEIHGTGWPQVTGWTVHDEFVSERRFDELVSTAAVVLVPYRRVFQSGVAVRAVELGTPFVGPKVSAHQDLYPAVPELLVDVDLPLPERTAAWTHAIAQAMSLGHSTRASITVAAADNCVRAWRDAVDGLVR